MRYPQKHMSRKYILVVALLLGVGTLAAAAAAHVRMSSQQRADIELLTPAPEKSAAPRPTAGQSAAPLFAASNVSRVRSVADTLNGSELAAGAVPTAQTFQQQLQARRYNNGRYQDYAGERSRRRSNAGGSSGGAFSGGGGGFSGGGGGWGGVSGTAAAARTRGAASTTPAPRQAPAARSSNNRSGGNGGNGGNSGNSAGAAAVPATVVAVAAPVTGAEGALPSGPSPAGAPEPLTLLLVGTGLAGLYGARKHIA